jgi:cellulose biosynthesis protein BcsQ
MTIISVSSFKGGTAKTSTTLHLGAALARFHKKRVLLVDFYAQGNLTAGLGLDPGDQESLAAVLQGNQTIDKIILSTSQKRMDLIPADKLLESKIRRDISVSESAIYGKSIFDTAPSCRAAEDYQQLTKEILSRL